MSSNNATDLTQDQKDLFYSSVRQVKDDLQLMGYSISFEDLQIAFLYGPYSKAFRRMITWFSTKISKIRKDKNIEVVEATDNIQLFVKQFRKFLKDVGCHYSFLKSGDIILNIKTLGEMYMLIDFISVQLKTAILLRRRQSKKTSNVREPSKSSKIEVKEEPKSVTPEADLTKACLEAVNNSFSESELKRLKNLYDKTYQDCRKWRRELIKDLDDTISTFAKCDVVKARNGKIPSEILKRRRMISEVPDVKFTDVLVAASIFKTMHGMSKNSVKSEEFVQDDKRATAAVVDHQAGQSSEIHPIRIKEEKTPQSSEIDEGKNKSVKVKTEGNNADNQEDDMDERELERYEFSERSQSIENYLMGKVQDDNEQKQNINEECLQKPSPDEQTSTCSEGANNSHSCSQQSKNGEQSLDVQESQNHMSEKDKNYDIKVSQPVGSIKYENIPTVYERLGSKLNEDIKQEKHLASSIIDGARMQGRVGSLIYNGFPTQGRAEISNNEGLPVTERENTLDETIFEDGRNRIVVKDGISIPEDCDVKSIERQLISMICDESLPSNRNQRLEANDVKTDNDGHRLVEHSDDGDNLIIKRYDITKDDDEGRYRSEHVGPKLKQKTIVSESGRVSRNSESSEKSFKSPNINNYENEPIKQSIEFPLSAASPVVRYNNERQPDEDKAEHYLNQQGPCRKKMKLNENNKCKHAHLEHNSDEIIDGEERKPISSNPIKGLLDEVIVPPINAFSDKSGDVDYRTTTGDIDYRTLFPAGNPWSTYNQSKPRFPPENNIIQNYRGIDMMLEERQIMDQETCALRDRVKD